MYFPVNLYLRIVMIGVDLHNHTNASHARNSVSEMVASAREHGLRIYGFSEHSPRPLAYSYPKEYRDHLQASFGNYVEEVLSFRQRDPELRVLLGMELDWFPAEPDFMQRAVAAYPFDYVIGGIHFLGTWGFDFSPEDWQRGPDFCEEQYVAYFRTLKELAKSGLVNIAAHPDIIKLFSVETFKGWLACPDSLDLVAEALTAIRDAGMGMEISSAGLRKPCREIYPGPEIMRLAAEIGVPITFGSDAHDIDTPAYGFDLLEKYARSFGYTHSLVFEHGERQELPF